MFLKKILFITFILSFSTLFAVDIKLDGTINTISGVDCQTATYRLGTTASYNGQNLDLLVKVLSEDNEYANSACVGISNNVLSLRLKNKDTSNTLASIDLKITVVQKNTHTPILVDKLYVTNFDLDRSNRLSASGTDDVYYKDPSKVYLMQETNVVKSEGAFYGKYTTKLKGQTTGNCNDSATLTTLECRAGVVYDSISTFHTRVQNDDAYSVYSNYAHIHRLIQFSFELDDIAPLIPNDIELTCGTTDYSTTASSWVESSLSTSYNNNLNIKQKLSMLDAQQIKLTINGNTEESYDFISIFDENGTELYKDSGFIDSDSFTIDNQPIILQLKSDFSENATGVTVTIQGIGCVQPLKGRFNIERTNSNTQPIMTDERNAWYTQIVGRDFDYSLVFYEEDFSVEKNITNVTVKIDLIDMDTNSSLYHYAFHIPDTLSITHVDITQPMNDLALLPASKDVRFRVNYGVDDEGSITQADCLSNPLLCTNQRNDDAKDNFAIRPNSFYISISDNNILRKENTTTLNNPLRVAAGYDYNLTLIASTYESNMSTSLGYDASLVKLLQFNTPGTCADENNGTENISFSNGTFNDLNFTHSNVGDYLLTLKDDTWTSVDSNKAVPDCISNQNDISSNQNSLSGCNIGTISDVNLSFYPYQFAVDFTVNNLPSSGHDDFLYMSDINLTDHNMSLQFSGSITAQNKNSSTTTNFTSSCVAKDVVLLPTAEVRVEDGIVGLGGIGAIQTSKDVLRSPERVAVNMARMTLFNNETLNNTNFDTIADIGMPVNIVSNKFIDEQNGTVFLDLRYNVQKHISRTINPVQILFNSLNVNSAIAYSTAKEMHTPDPYIPSGSQDINDTKNFYFARVASDRLNYPTVYTRTNSFIRTPLNIDIFCDKNISYCKQTNLIEHTDKSALSKVHDGWYPSIEHNTALDGNVSSLISPTIDLTIEPNSNIDFTNGRNGTVINTFNNCNNNSFTVEIIPNTALLYDANESNNGHPKYIVSCSDKNASELSGVGLTGNILDDNLSTKKTYKMDW